MSEASSERTQAEPPPSVTRPDRRFERISGAIRAVYWCGAALFFALGALGAVLPGLPATPFLLLTSLILVRVSPAWNRRLLRSRFFGPILRDWQEHRGIRPDVKIQAIVAVLLAVTLTLLLMDLSPAIRAIVATAAAIGVLVIARLPTFRPR